jgi:hypothetical protein
VLRQRALGQQRALEQAPVLQRESALAQVRQQAWVLVEAQLAWVQAPAQQQQRPQEPQEEPASSWEEVQVC